MPPAIWSKAWAVQSLIRVGDVRGKIELAENPYFVQFDDCSVSRRNPITRLSRGLIFRNSQRNLQGAGFVGGGIEDAGAEGELAGREVD